MKKLVLACLLVVALVLPAFGANDTAGNTWVLDTAGSISTSGFYIGWIIWTNISNDGDDLVINETNNGDTIVELKGKAGVDMIVPFYGKSGWVPSFYLQTLDSGTVQVRLGRP